MVEEEEDDYPMDYFGVENEVEAGLLIRLMVIMANDDDVRRLFFEAVLLTDAPIQTVGPIITEMIERMDKFEYKKMKEIKDKELDKYK